MAKPGPKPTPTKLLLMRGNPEAKRRKEPAVIMGRPVMPGDLTEEQQRLWRKLLTSLDNQGLVAKIDGAVLERYCVLYGLWTKMKEFVQKYGETLPQKNKDGVITGFYVFPQVSLMLKYHRELSNIEASFGMSPSARASLGKDLAITRVATSTEPEGKERFFSQG